MSLLYRRVCPHCGTRFPRITSPDQWVVGRFPFIKGLRCKDCGKGSLYRVNWGKAVFWWPAAVLMLAIPVGLRALRITQKALWFRKELFAVLALGCVLAALESFAAAVDLQRQPAGEAPVSRFGRWLPLVGLVVFLVAFGVLTGGWQNVIVGGGVALVFWLFAARSGK